MSNGKVSNVYERLWKLQAAVNKLVLDGKREPLFVAKALQAILSYPDTVSHSSNQCWREQDGIIYFSVTSKGMTGKEWIKHFEKKHLKIGYVAECALLSEAFKPNMGVTTEVIILKGMLFQTEWISIKKIRAFAAKRKLTEPNLEVGCLIRDTFSDEDIEAFGLTEIVTMHKRINDSACNSHLLSICRGRNDNISLDTQDGTPSINLNGLDNTGFVFTRSTV